MIFGAYGVDPGVKNKKLEYVKRVTAVSGDRITYRANGTLTVNGKRVSQSYISKNQQTAGTLDIIGVKSFTLASLSKFENWPKFRGATQVPKGYYFVLGDNRIVSNDSRYYGFVPKNKIYGVVKTPFWNKNHKLVNDQN
ncbi:Signal peptidase I [Pediococcus damnosus]|nr:Signal peptidase I [Pediococcus damnosus]